MTVISTYMALFFTVALLVTTAYFIMGGLPLLTLAHDTPLDGRFIRRFFEVYCTCALVSAAGATAGYALWGKGLFALGASTIALVVVMFRRFITPAMERLGTQIQASESTAIAHFRRLHAAALLINCIQLCALVWGVFQISV